MLSKFLTSFEIFQSLELALSEFAGSMVNIHPGWEILGVIVRAIVFLLAIHFLAFSVADAQEASAEAPQVIKVTLGEKPSDSKVDECKDVLPQLEADYQETEQKYRSLNLGSQNSQENYLLSFNEMTQVLFQMTEARELETDKISLSRDQLRESLNRFNQNKNSENSKALQDHYLDLTVRLYSAMMDSQKGLETLKGQISQVEANRGQYEKAQKELESLDHQKLALEAKLISLKIKCQPAKRY